MDIWSTIARFQEEETKIFERIKIKTAQLNIDPEVYRDYENIRKVIVDRISYYKRYQPRQGNAWNQKMINHYITNNSLLMAEETRLDYLLAIV